MVRTANLRLVVATATVDTKYIVVIHLAVSPAFVVGNFPAVVSFFKILFEN